MKKSYYIIVFASILAGLASCSKDRDDAPEEVLVESLEFVDIDPDQGTPTLAMGDSLKLEVGIVPSNASNKKVFWSSSSPEVAEVAQDGTVKGIGPGGTVIKVRADDASRAGAEITLRVLDTTNAITSFKVNGNNATIIGNTIGFAFPADSDVDLSKLSPVIEHTGVAVDPDSGAEQDFTDPVEYTVTAENGETKTYTVTIEKGLKSTNAITSFKVNGNNATIIGNTIGFAFPADSDVDLSKLAPVIEHTGVAVDPNSGAEQDFTDPVEYTVTAENGETKTYTVTIEKGLKSTNAITSFKVNGNNATIIGNTIGFAFPADSDVDLSKLSPVIEHTGAAVDPDSGAEQDFTDPVEYTVTAENGDTKTYTATIEKGLKSTNAITSFKVNGNNATIIGNTIGFTFPADSDVDLSKLAPVIEHTGMAVDPNSGAERDFTDPVEYTVTAENGDTKTYTATIDIAFTAESDRAALMAIYNANPEAQDGLTVWGSEQPLNDWEGVTTNAEGRVIDIKLYSKGLKMLPAEIGNLTALEYLYLDNNQLETIPSEIGNLKALERLILTNSQLETIPSAIGNLTALKGLYLYNNQLETIPAAIGNLRALVRFDLTNNKLGTIPAEIGNLTALEYLYLANNKLGTIPAEIGNLTALEYLYLTNNQLETIPSAIGNLTALENLNLENNQLETIPSAIGNLTALKGLSLYNNQLETIPAAIGNLKALERLYLNKNPNLTSIPASVCTLGNSLGSNFGVDEGLCG